MELLPKQIADTLPKLYTQEKLGEDALAYVKLFTPWTGWTWYILEWDGEDLCFGYVVGFEKELGYFSLAEIASVRGPGGIRIERDLYFQPTKLRDVRGLHS